MNEVILIILAIAAFLWIAFLVVFLGFVRLWLQAWLSGAHISILELVAMKFRKAPMREIVRLKIMAAQGGLSIPTSKIESAILLGADAERAVLALIRAKETGTEVTWEEVISHDAEERLRNKPLAD